MDDSSPTDWHPIDITIVLIKRMSSVCVCTEHDGQAKKGRVQGLRNKASFDPNRIDSMPNALRVSLDEGGYPRKLRTR